MVAGLLLGKVKTIGEKKKMTWIVGMKEELQKSIDKKIRLPENGSIEVMLRIDKEPRKDVKQWASTEPPKTSYVWEASDGRVLYASEKLTLEITGALSKYEAKIQEKNTTEVLVEIFNKGTKTKPIWFVAVKAGI